MKNLQDFWNTSTQNRIIALVILFLLLFCILAICIIAGISGFIVFGNASPAPPSHQPADASATSTQTPTSTSAPTKNNNSEYFTELQDVLGELTPLWNEFTIFTSYGSDHPEAINDPDWRDEFKELLDKIDKATEKLEKLPPAPAQFIEMHKVVLEFNVITRDITRVMRLYLDTQDDTLVSELKPLLEKMTKLNNQLEAEVEQLQNK